MLSSIVSAATEYCPETKILPVSIPETGLSTDEDIQKAVAAIKNSGYRHIFFIGPSLTLKPLLEMGAQEGIAANPDFFWTGPWGAVTNLEAVEADSTLAKAISGFGSVTLEAGVAGKGGDAYDNFIKAFQSLANPNDLQFINSRQPYPDSFIPPPTFNNILRGSPFFMYDGK